ncbi:MAG: septum formation initiator family protein [Candidatus Paceibacterota bacterium]|jgi:cell division protein FtsB
MRNFQKKNKLKNILQSKPVLIFLVILVFVFAWSAIGLISKAKETAKNKKIAETKIEELLKQKEKLTSDIEKLNTEKGVEESIREKFGWAKEGENLIVVVDDKNEVKNLEEENQKGFFNFLKNLFK